MEFAEKNKPHKSRRVIARNFYAALLFLIIAGASGFIMLTHEPSDYEPAAPRSSRTVSTYLTHDIAQTWYNNVEAGTPFELIVEQESLNDIVANESRLGFSWPVEFSGATFSTPAVVFNSEQVMLMTPIELGRIPLVITILSSPSLGEDGLLTLNIKSVKAGMLNITPLARTFASGMIKKQLESIETSPENAWLADIADAMLDNEPIEPVWPSHDGHMVRLTDVSLNEGRMSLYFNPVVKKSTAATAGSR